MKRAGAIPSIFVAMTATACVSQPFTGAVQPTSPFAPPEDARSFGDFLVARYAAMTNDPEAAANYYASAMVTAPSASPDVSSLAERAVFSALLAGDYRKAVKLAQRADDAGSDATLIGLTLGVDAMSRGRGKDVVTQLDSPSFGPFNRSIAEGILAWNMVRSDGAGAAVIYLDSKLTGSSSIDSTTLTLKGLIQASAGDDDAALATFESLRASGSRIAIGVEAHARLLAARGERDKARALLIDFRDAIGNNAALERLRHDIETGADIPVVRLSPKQGAARAIYMPAAVLTSRTKDDFAGVYFALALALDPDLQEARSLWATALEKADRSDEALAILSQVPRSSPFFATARGQMAWALRRDGQVDEALTLAGQALDETPDRGLLVQLADLFRSVDRYGEADQILTGVIDTDAREGRTDWRLLYARGATRERLGRWPEAETDLKAALALQPNDASVLNYLGYSYIDRGIRLEEGMSLIQQALALEPHSGFVTDSLGWAYYRLGRYEMATRYLERAVELEPGDPTLNDHLGDAYWQSGRTLEATFQWEQALKLDPGDSDRDKIEAKLRDGLVAPPVVEAESDTQPLPQRP